MAPENPQTLIWRLFVAVMAVIAAVALRFWLLQNMGVHLPYITFFPAVTIAALYGGRVSGTLATVLSTLYVYFWQTASNPGFTGMINLEGVGIFFFTGLLLSALSEKIFQARLAATQAAELARHQTQRAEEAVLAQRKIERSEARFRELFENSPTGMVAVDPHSFRFVQANRNAQQMYGYSEAELKAMTIAELTYPDDRAETAQHNERLASGRINRHSTQKRYLRKDGSHFWAQISISTINGPDGRAELFIGSFYDITGLVASEAKIALHVRQLEDAMHGTLLAVSSMVEQRDPFVFGHERRVGVIAAAIAREMDWPEDKCKALQMIGLVHDVGKIGIPAEILSKPGKLSALEFEMVKNHAEKGYEIFRDVKFPFPIAEIICQHHERLDGSGYPRGLKEDEISPEARILAVADVVEAMASHRPYRPAFPIEAALEEMAGHRGTLYWAGAVDALLRLFRDKHYQLPP